jgi:hypothetical protein
MDIAATTVTAKNLKLSIRFNIPADVILVPFIKAV